MGRGGFGQRMRGAGALLLTGVLAVGSTACSSGSASPPPAAKAPSTAATALCASVLLVPPPPDELTAVSTQTIRDGEESGDATLDRLAKMWLTELTVPNRTGSTKAEPLIASRCRQLGIPTGTITLTPG